MKRFAYIDIEANHDNWNHAEIIEIAILVLNDKEEVIDHFQTLIKPRYELKPEIISLTGIQPHMLINAPEFNKIANTVYEKLQDTIIIAHKIDFDYEILKDSLATLEINLNNKKICTLKMSQRLIPGLKSYSLKALSDMLYIKHKDNHRAQDDVETLSKLHHHLRLLNGEIQLFEEYLEPHQKIIQKAQSKPGIIVFKYEDDKEVIKTDNVHLSLKELLILKPKNKERILKNKTIDINYFSTVTETFLQLDQYQSQKLSFCIYSFYDKNRKLILRVGKTHPRRMAHFYFSSKRQAQKNLSTILSKLPKQNYIYKDSKQDRLEIIEQNKVLLDEIKKRGELNKNLLIRSHLKYDNKYHYIILKKNRKFTSFSSSDADLKSDDLKLLNIQYKKLSPEKYMNILQGLQWIKNQKNKTESLQELKSNV